MELSKKFAKSQRSIKLTQNIRKSSLGVTSPYTEPYQMNNFSLATSPRCLKTKPTLNKFPLSNVSHRALPPLIRSKPCSINLKQRQIQIRNHFSIVNSQQRALTAKILSAQEKNIDIIIENNDSFNERYSPSKHKFSHKLIGEVQLPRKFFNIIPQERELEVMRKVELKDEKDDKNDKNNKNLIQNNPTVNNLHMIPMNKSKERLRRALTAIKHYKQMKIDPMIIPKIHEYIPGVPYGLPKSKEFLAACKEGDIETVTTLIAANKWLAHVFDTSGQSGLHWAVKRSHMSVAKTLHQNGA